VKAKGKASVWEVPRDALQRLMTTKPDYALALMANMAGQLRTSSKILRALHQR
jgi:CRP-like cAMP-binding protein